jgi:hypothetical protein
MDFETGLDKTCSHIKALVNVVLAAGPMIAKADTVGREEFQVIVRRMAETMRETADAMERAAREILAGRNPS